MKVYEVLVVLSTGSKTPKKFKLWSVILGWYDDEFYWGMGDSKTEIYLGINLHIREKIKCPMVKKSVKIWDKLSVGRYH